MASNDAVVVTTSGSKYQLGTASSSNANNNNNNNAASSGDSSAGGMSSFNFFGGGGGGTAVSTSAGVKQQQQQQQPSTRVQQMQEKYQLEFPLTGETIGNGRGTRYLLAGKPKRKPSGRCEISMAYRATPQLEPTGDPVVIKLSTHKDKLDREYTNYQRIQKGGLMLGGGTNSNAFVKCYDFLPVLEGSLKYAQHSALVLERGSEDLREYRSKHGAMDEALTRSALLAATKCIDTLHRARLVYTDLKAENLIFMDGSSGGDGDGGGGGDVVFKGVDLESAIPVRGNPLDYTPEASPPEFAVRYLEGEAYDFVLDYSYDVWSFGMLAYELGNGRGYFDKKQPAHIMKALGLGFQPPKVEDVVDDGRLCDLINKCLSLDPRRRPTSSQILSHPYFRGDGATMPKLFGW
jgi:serine/threonine protein kinase